MSQTHPPQIELHKTISHPIRSAMVAGFDGRDTMRGVNCIVLKGGLLPGGDQCVGVYFDVVDQATDEGAVIYILGEKEVYCATPETAGGARVETFPDAPVFGNTSLPCIAFDDMASWDRDDVEIT